MYHIPLNMHNIGTLVLTMVSVHFGAAIRNYTTSENAILQGGIQKLMAASNPPQVKNNYLDVPKGPGLGFELNDDALRSELFLGKPWWC